jgi:hypothetical protein
MVVFAYSSIGIGFLLDAITMYWGYRSSRRYEYKSGIIIVPLLFYYFGVAVAPDGYLSRRRLVGAVGFTLLHLFCYFIVPGIFSKLFRKDKSS